LSTRSIGGRQSKRCRSGRRKPSCGTCSDAALCFIFTDFGATMLAVYLTAFVYLSPGLSPLQIAAGAVSASLPEP
jgi:hypothetical protein